jgi:putative ATPase
VAQQYLPETLQGKVFYRPSDQGYEAGIRETVRRRREAQLEAMMELDGRSAEILTFSKGGGARDRWLERAVSRASERLALIRERLFTSLSLSRHHLMLDLKAGEGLITWEALRRVPEGGVWSLCEDETAASFLQSRAQALAELERPKVLFGELKSLPELLRQQGEAAIRFDVVVGRNALYREEDKAGCLNAVSSLLRPGGQLALCEIVPSMGMRLSELLDLGSEKEAFRKRLAEAEDRIYTAADNPLVNWSVEDFCGILEEAGFKILQRDTPQLIDRRKIRSEDIDRWFARRSGSYADRASAVLSTTELERLHTICSDQLSGREADWQSVVLFVHAEKPKG